MNARQTLAGCLLGVLLATACQTRPGILVPAAPQRPTFSSDPKTTVEGSAELEAGVAFDPGDRFSAPALIKWGVSPTAELFAGFSPYERVIQDGDDPDGIGDLLIGTKHQLLAETESQPAVAVLVQTKLPTARSGQLGTGEIDFAAAATASKTFDDFTGVAYYQLGVLGQPGAADTEIEHGLAAALSVPLWDPRWTGFGETALRIRPETDMEMAVLTGGLNYAIDEGMIFDAALAVGLDDDSPDLVLLFGVTYNFGRWTPVTP